MVAAIETVVGGQCRRYDVVVVGGGIVGAVQALLFARQGRSVLLLEATEPDSVTDALQQRSVALSYRSHELLVSQGLWPSTSVCPIREIHVTEKGSFGSVRITAGDLQVDNLGFVVANHSLESHLRQLLQSHSQIEFLQPARADLVQNTATGVELKVTSRLPAMAGTEGVEAASDFADGQQGSPLATCEFTARCDLLVAADGTQSTIRQRLGLRLTRHDYGQVAVVGNVQCQMDHRNIAHERFTESGPLALLPLSDRCLAMVYSASADDAEALTAMSDQDFLRLLQRRFGGKLGRFTAVGTRVVFPLSLSESESQVAGSCVLIGNAVRTLHPVAGQGLNLALRDVFSLAASIGSTNSGEPVSCSDAGSVQRHNPKIARALSDFQKKRKADQHGTVRRTDMLARLFSRHRSLAPMRGLGLLLLDGITPLRKRFGADSAGLGVPLGRLPASSFRNESNGEISK